MRRLPVVLALVLLAPACKHATPVDPNAALVAARARLAQLATTTANASYDATYRFVQQGSNASGTIRIRQVPPQYRIDIATKDVASFYSLRIGTISCSQKGTKKSCLLVARKGEAVPALFDPGVQRLFRDAVVDLSAHPDDYVVSVVPPASSSGSASPSTSASPSALPAAECFLVNRPSVSASPSGTPRPGFENGTYCFAEQGVATLIDVSSGTLTLTAIGPMPNSQSFRPIAHVVTLPSLRPTPSKKK